MGGRDNDSPGDQNRRNAAQERQICRAQERARTQRENLENDLRSWIDDAPSSLRGPFERFKSFVDSNFNTLSEGFKNFPSNVSELKSNMQQEREARREEERDIWMRWTGSEDSPDHIRLQVERASAEERGYARDATKMLLMASYERNKHVPTQKILDLYRDNEWSFGGLDQFANPLLSSGGACYYKPETVDNLPSTARWGWSSPRPQWLSVDWFKRSPHSPIRLEAHPELCCEGTKWRRAFEDLLSASLDKPMVSEEKVGQRVPYGKPQSTFYGPGLEWMLSLQCRGILPPQLPSLYKPVSLFDGFDEVNRPRTAHFMHDIERIISSENASMYPLVERDLNLLIDDVAIKSGPETEAKPLPLKVKAVEPWRLPSTEQELYDAMPPLNAPERGWKDELTEPKDALIEALDSGDARAAGEFLDAYYTTNGSIKDLLLDTFNNFEELFAFTRTDLWSTLEEAVGQSYLLHAVGEALDEHESDQRSASPFKDKKFDLARGMLLKELQDRVIAREELKHEPRTDQVVSTQRPDILSQLTTSHKIRHPDGTVTTKVVMKQKFADGREEEHESVHTTQEHASTMPEKPSSKDLKEQPMEKKKNGWFWS